MNPTLVIARKELREMLRDKRVRNAAFVMPFFLVVMILYLFGFIAGTLGQAKNQKIHVVKSTHANPIVDALKKAGVTIADVDSQSAGEKLVREGKANLVLKFDDDVVASIKENKETKILATYDPKQEKSPIALSFVRGTVSTLNDQSIRELFKQLNLPDAAREPFKLTENKLKVGEADTNTFLLSILPYFIILWAFTGGLSSASDLVAGEKEKNTLETLLIAPIGRSQIAIGKFLALCVICFCSSLSALLGIIIAGSSKLPFFAPVFPKGLGFGVSEAAVIILTLIPTVALFASLLLAISAYARNSREAQSYLALVQFVVLTPMIFSQFIGYTDFANDRWISAVPILNTAVTVRQALLGQVDYIGLLITIGISAVLATIAVKIAINLFRKEKVLVRV